MNEWWLLIGFMVLFSIALVIALFPLHRPKFSMMLMTPLIFSVVALGYWRWGAWPDWKHYLQQQEKQEQVQAMLKSVRNPQELIDKLRNQLEKHPESARGWFLLGRLYASQDQWLDARDAYIKAHRLRADDEAISVNYAQSLWQLNHQQFNDKIRSLVNAVLKKNPNQPDALAMLAMDAFVAHAYQQAIDYWQRLLKIAPPQSVDAQTIRKAIAQAQKKI